ncbi:alpha/beta hydrolase [Actinomadura rayongensis]|uniref:Acyl-CoA:diacylglycerol acyltransferase n=1 Tax=Actinomadura rayongensis TaxID=1429076 RepID=A0A6I4VY04_9ACTN|nr:alpha/beta hydrolase family protein [Actinomadura rayongensis]MXQ63279.1 prolyl oligopeptidase family serine peptidase [Actinomadura rayongensis]
MQNRRAFCRTAAVTAGAALGGGLLAAPARAEGARVVAEKRLGSHIVDLTVHSAAMNRDLPVRLMLPQGWSKTADRTWPVVYAFHGGNENYQAWNTHTDIAARSLRRQVIVVLPEGGYAGGYTDWWNYGFGGSYAWETFHLKELRPLLEQEYRAGTKRAAFGQSTGGYGALIYAARHPGMFKYAAAYSPFASLLTAGVSTVLNTGLDGLKGWNGLGFNVDKYTMWGDPFWQHDIWEQHDPVSQAANLRGTKLYVSVAKNGLPGPLDPPTAQFADPAEAFCYYTTKPFLDRLKELNIPVKTHLYERGTHSWVYWQDELDRSWPAMMRAIGA